MDDIGRKQLSRLASHALRHEPELYGLVPDTDGWVPVNDLLRAARASGGRLSNTSVDDLAEMIAKSDKERHQLDGGLIRALYGHSLDQKIQRATAEPPTVLFHGTSRQAWLVIQQEGLKPMGRQYVHLSVDQRMAEQVGLRKGTDVVVISVLAAAAHRDETVFRLGNDRVWLADPIGPKYLALEENPSAAGSAASANSPQTS